MDLTAVWCSVRPTEGSGGVPRGARRAVPPATSGYWRQARNRRAPRHPHTLAHPPTATSSHTHPHTPTHQHPHAPTRTYPHQPTHLHIPTCTHSPAPPPPPPTHSYTHTGPIPIAWFTAVKSRLPRLVISQGCFNLDLEYGLDVMIWDINSKRYNV